jgi:hypothetical protein
MIFTAISFSQTIEEGVGEIQNYNPESVFRTNYKQDRDAECGEDTILYLTSKLTTPTPLSINNSSSAHTMCQYFDGQDGMKIHGVKFHAYKTDSNGGDSIWVVASVRAATADSLPTGVTLAEDSILVDNNFYLGNLDSLAKFAHFDIPAIVTGPYTISIRNDSPNAITMYGSSYLSNDGQGEWLASARIGFNWARGYNVNVGGNPYDADMLFEPVVSYDLQAHFNVNPNCLNTGGIKTLVNNSSPIIDSRMYNLMVLQGNLDTSYTWDFGDASPTVNGKDVSHDYASGEFQITLTDTIWGWNMICTADTTISTCYQPVGISDIENSEFAIFPNPANDNIVFKSTSEMTKIELYDLSGKLILKNENLFDLNVDIDISNFLAGMYVTKTTFNSGEVINQRIQVIH